MQIILKAVGVKPLLLHNVELANPRSEWARRIADLRGVPSRRRTDDWYAQMEYLQFMGALYEIPDIDVGIPAENVRRSLVGGAKATRQGTQADRAINLIVAAVPLVYEGPRSAEELWQAGKFAYTRMMRGSSGASPTTYPIFREWALTVSLDLDESVLSLRDCTAIAEKAGRAEGLGACRKQGYGRYEAIVELP